jgi:hypothetical protein
MPTRLATQDAPPRLNAAPRYLLTTRNHSLQGDMLGSPDAQ